MMYQDKMLDDRENLEECLHGVETVYVREVESVLIEQGVCGKWRAC
jgi:hypothetical protein